MMLYEQFEIKDLSSFILSRSLTQFAAFKFKDIKKVGRSHIIIQLVDLGLLVGYLQ